MNELEQYRRVVGILMSALEFYADPETYHAIMIVGDRPCGDFEQDFSDDHGHEHYDRPMPGKLARETIQRVTATYPELTYYSLEGDDESDEDDSTHHN
jgi:hypothetical protein